MPYKNGYDVLPKLKKLNNPIFEIQDRDFFIDEKRNEITKRKCCFYHDISQITLDTVCSFITSQTGAQGSFEEIAMQLREDITIHSMSEYDDWLAAAHVCFPAGWCPSQKIGKSFYEMHKDVPDMRLTSSRKIVEAMVYSSPYERNVWTVTFDKNISAHPSYKVEKFDINNPKLYIKYERQCIIGFPNLKSTLFTICQYFIEEKDIDKQALRNSLLTMSPRHVEYKNLQNSYNDLLFYLS